MLFKVKIYSTKSQINHVCEIHRPSGRLTNTALQKGGVPGLSIVRPGTPPFCKGRIAMIMIYILLVSLFMSDHCFCR